MNRIDEIAVFGPLDRDVVETIVDKFATELTERLAGQGLELALTASARAHLAAVGFDLEAGARPLRRAFQRLVEDPLAEALVAGTVRAGDRVVVDTELDATGGTTIGLRVSVPDAFDDLPA